MADGLVIVDEGLSHHEAGRRFGIDRRTVKKMLSYSAPPGYRRTKPVRRPKLDGFTGIIDAILEADTDPDVPRKQRHTAHRIFERLRDEHGFAGSYTIVKDYVRSRRQSTREAFVPLHHPPGHAQVDFGEATVEIGGRREKVAFFCLILPHSNVWFVKAYPRETTEAFLDGHVSAFAFLGGVPRSILYDNTTLASFKAAWPGIAIEIETNHRSVDPSRRDFDAWLAYSGETSAPRPLTRREETLLEETLYEEALLPVCSPALLAARGRPRSPAALRDWPLLYDLGWDADWSYWFAKATCGSIRLKLLKIAALVRISVRRIKFAMASGCPYQSEFQAAHARLSTAAA